MEKTRAKISILSELLSFPTIREKDWTANFMGKHDVLKGDLISLNSAPDSKWYVSWVHEIKTKNGFKNYLLESIEDGSMCWWTNIGINVYSRKKVSERPTWRWSDKQFTLYDRWLKVCKRNDAYIVLPKVPIFNKDNSVTLDVRIRFGWSEFQNPENFLNWKKLTMKEMSAYYLSSVEKHNSIEKNK